MFVVRFFVFKLVESPKYLLSRNRQAEAIDVVQHIARYNSTNTWLTDQTFEQLTGEDRVVPGLLMSKSGYAQSKLSLHKVRALFHGWKLGTTTVLLWIIWLTYVPLHPSALI